MTDQTLDELVRAGSILTAELDFKTLISVLVEQSQDISASSLSVLYLRKNPDTLNGDFIKTYQRGKFEVPGSFKEDNENFIFIEECGEAAVLLERKESPFRQLLLNDLMNSAIALPISTNNAFLGVLILNSKEKMFYNRRKLNFLEAFSTLAGGMLNNSRLYSELKAYLKEIEELKLYQENIFSSMTNLLIASDKSGKIKYFNRAASDIFKLDQSHIDTDISDFFKHSVGKKIINTIKQVYDEPEEIPGIEGIFKNNQNDEEIDFSLNISPLFGKTGKLQGNTFLFTDQTRERELQSQVHKVIEDKRVIKDMFSRYLSSEIVHQLTDSPDLVKMGGDKKTATIFFADIRGYTSFSEGREPEYIINILNDYFNEAVEIVIETNGYIDKFIGDCIMAAWGVPLQTEQQDAISAVTCALRIQQLVKSVKRKFWKGEASGLQIGIGMHSGDIVAGNLGSSRRMNYTVIGDTVNIAARLEGIAKSGEIIITKNTMDYIEGNFKVKKMEPVKVKGKANPIEIYSVLDFK
ncbi:MAG: PAS domain-containing protein [Spirochaetes bacterium]|nr:PAS domain-containing protein [Spirochaetota bacterium]